MDFGKIISITILVFAVLTLYFNFLGKPLNFFGDINIDKIGFKLYIPVLSTLILSVVLTFLISLLPK